MKESRIDPLSAGTLTNLFKTNQKSPYRLITRESSFVEFKESYNHAGMSMYFKTIAAFANNNGGYLIFGVGDRPRILKGLNDKKLLQFEELKVEEFTKNLCDYFSPEIKWTHTTFEYKDLYFGIIYIYELDNKPAICKKNYDTKDEKYTLKESDIYYRYGGRSQRIKFSELQSIIESKRKSEERQWLKFLLKASKIGVSNSALLDFKSGKLDGIGGSVLIDESLLSKISFIKEGSFSESEGKPTLRLIGDVESISTGKIIVNETKTKVKGITSTSIIESFLTNQTIEQPIEYIKQICFSTSGNLPVYYFILQGKISIDEVVNILRRTNARGQAKRTLIKKLSADKSTTKEFPYNSNNVSYKKKLYRDDWLAENISDEISSQTDFKYCLQAISYMSDYEIQKHETYIRNKLLFFHTKYYVKAAPDVARSIREAICKVDESLNYDLIINMLEN